MGLRRKTALVNITRWRVNSICLDPSSYCNDNIDNIIVSISGSLQPKTQCTPITGETPYFSPQVHRCGRGAMGLQEQGPI